MIGRRAQSVWAPGLASVQALFLSSDVGVFYDFATAAQVKEDSAATTAAAVSGPVGAQLDLSGLGYHAIQATTANKPTLRRTPTTQRYWIDAFDTARALNATFAEAPEAIHVGRVTPEGIVWGTETWAATQNVLKLAQYNAGIVARQREFSASEMALMESYFSRQLPNLGPNLFANPEFNSDTAWTKGTAWTISDGFANGVLGTAGGLLLSQEFTESGYAIVSADITEHTLGSPSIYGTGWVINSPTNAPSSVALRLTENGKLSNVSQIANGTIGFRVASATVSNSFKLDNAAFRKIL